MRKLATIRVIDDLTPIEGADKIELAHTGGWQCVVGKGDFDKGDLAVFFEIDSALDANDERYSFLRDRCYKAWKLSTGEVVDECIRIRTARFKGNISQGLFMPVVLFPEITDPCEGVDLTELLNVRLYDDVAETAGRITGKVKIQGEAKGNFPSYLCPKTDQERLQNLTTYFDTMREVPFELTEKNDGSSMTVIYAPEERPEDPFFVCSRSLERKKTDDCLFWQMAVKYDLENKLRLHYERTKQEYALQGELVGPGVNGNRDRYTEHEFHVFNIWSVKEHRYVRPAARTAFCEEYSIPHVRVLEPCRCVFNDLTTMEAFLDYVKGKTLRGNEREGVVFKNHTGDCQFKVINNDYLLKEKD